MSAGSAMRKDVPALRVGLPLLFQPLAAVFHPTDSFRAKRTETHAAAGGRLGQEVAAQGGGGHPCKKPDTLKMFFFFFLADCADLHR